MALAASLIPNFQYRTKPGALGLEEGDEIVVTVVDNTPFPDGDPEGRQRKVTVLLPDGSTHYVLPRQLEDRPVGVAPQAGPGFEPNDGPGIFGTERHLPAFPPMPVMPSVTILDENGEAPETIPTLDVETAFLIAANEITDPMDPRLDHLRPKVSRVKRKYINREFANGMTDMQVLLNYVSDEFRVTNDGYPVNVALKGETQSGKTLTVQMLAIAWSELIGLPKPMPIFTLSGSSGVTDFDLFGQTTSYTDPLTGRSRLIWLPGIVALAAQCGGILYLDEINAMGERVTTSLHSLLDGRHLFVNRNKPEWREGQFMPEEVKAHPDLWIIATYNEGYRGMSKMNEALHQRFDHILWNYDDKVEAKLVKSPTVRLIGEAFRFARANNKLRTPFGTAAMERFERNLAAFGIDVAIEILLGMFEGSGGPASEREIAREIVDTRFRSLLEDEARTAETTTKLFNV